MTNTPRLLDKLVSMTALHDVELMEFSLLKTLEEFIKPQELLILKLDRNGQPYYQLRLRQESYEITVDQISIGEEILAAIDVVRNTNRPFSRQLDPNRILTIWHLMQLKSVEVILVSITLQPLSKLDSYLVNGLLGVYRNFFTVLTEAQHDQLTGLANRKTFDDLINKIHSQRPPVTDQVAIERRQESDSSPYWLGMADLDHFKRINDTWGHLYGDEVLLLTAQLMQGHFREHDHLFRFGGEEFVIILRAANQELANQAFERFRMSIEQHIFPQVGQVTVSIGVTQMDPNLFSATLLDHADKALYCAKGHGRNQVCFYDTLVESGEILEPEIVTGTIDFF
ncbi:MAG: GGDEF domain-containing protein [Desulfobulbus sp.]|nr:GGDEF domain-containing protein [Desulfobulbus sp.]